MQFNTLHISGYNVGFVRWMFRVLDGMVYMGLHLVCNIHSPGITSQS